MTARRPPRISRCAEWQTRRRRTRPTARPTRSTAVSTRAATLRPERAPQASAPTPGGGANVSVTVTLDAPSTVGRVILYGDRDCALRRAMTPSPRASSCSERETRSCLRTTWKPPAATSPTATRIQSSRPRSQRLRGSVYWSSRAKTLDQVSPRSKSTRTESQQLHFQTSEVSGKPLYPGEPAYATMLPCLRDTMPPPCWPRSCVSLRVATAESVRTAAAESRRRGPTPCRAPRARSDRHRRA